MLVRPLLDGPLDIVGDVHGEFDALQQLLARLGYGGNGEHPAGRRLVFVGDLCDRGPQSATTLRFVADLVHRGLAQLTLGNHELNTLRLQRKPGSEWFFDPQGRARVAEHRDILDFLRAQPLALERPDLRVSHAAWVGPAIAALRMETDDAATAFARHEARVTREAANRGLASAAQEESAQWREHIGDEHAQVPLLRHTGLLDEFLQVGNPLRLVSSGVERLATRPFFAAGKWRFVDRVRWWREYPDRVPVVFGHYWRWWDPAAHALLSKGERLLFEGAGPADWLPTRLGTEAMCIDYSVGARFKERKLGRAPPYSGRLAALRWPERELVFDAAAGRPACDGAEIPCAPPGTAARRS